MLTTIYAIIAYYLKTDKKSTLQTSINSERVKKNRLRKLITSEVSLYNSLFDSPLYAVATMDATNKIIFANDKFCALFNYSPKELIGKPFHLLFTEELFAASEGVISKKVRRKSNKKWDCLTNNGGRFYVETTFHPVKLNGKKATIIFLGEKTGHIDDTKKNVSLDNNECRYKNLYEQNQIGFYQINRDGVITECNQAFAGMLQYHSPSELVNTLLSDYDFEEENKNEALAEENKQNRLTNKEGIFRRKDGSPLFYLQNITIQKNERTNEELFDGAVIDIAEKKQAELHLKEINERFNLVSKATNDMVWDWDLATGKVYRNAEGWKKIFRSDNYFPEEGSVWIWDRRIHPDDLERVKANNESIHHNSEHYFEIECRVRRDDGTYAHIFDRANIIRNANGQAIRLIGVTQDISTSKEAELRLAKSELRFRSLVQNGSDLISILDENTRYLYSSPAVERILGYEPEYMIGKEALSFIHPDDIPVLLTYMLQLKKRVNGNIEVRPFRFRNSGGDWRWLESRITDMRDNPEIKGYVVNSRDVTERITSQEEIKKLSIIAKKTVNAVIITDVEENILWVNDAFTNITEYTLDEVKGKKTANLLQGKDTSPAHIRFMRQNIKKAIAFECDIVNYSKSGRKYWIRNQNQPQFDEAGKLKYYFAIQTDITKEKEAEAVLKASEERYKYLFNNNPASIIIWDLENFKILEVKNTAMRQYSYERTEFLAKTVLDLRLPNEVEKLYEFVAVAKQKQDFSSFATWKHINKTGEIIYMNISSHHIQYKGKSVILALATNITDKVYLEKELEKERLQKQQEITQAVITAQEHERQELGSELHDNINQILAGSLLFLGLAKKDFIAAKNPYLIETDRLINSAISEIRKLSHTLIPPSYNESKLHDVLEDLIGVIKKTTGIKASLQVFGIDESIMSDQFKLNIYRVVQEQLNNIIKYANAKTIIVRLMQKENKTVLSIKDDGVGFDTSTKSKGVGLMNIRTRTSFFNGKLSMISSPGQGCEMLVEFN